MYRPVPPQVDLPAVDHDVLALWRERDVFDRSLGRHRGPPALGVQRGPADRQRHARHPPRRGARVQGRVPALPDDEGLPRPPQGRLGLPRPARRARGREGARLLGQEGHRGVRHRRVQRAVPRVGAAARRRVRRPHRAHGLLGRHGRRLLDDGPALRRERVVVAQADLRQGPARAGPPRLAVLPALRHRAVRPRARAGLRDRRRPVGLRALPRHRRRRSPSGTPGVALLVWTTTPWTLVSNTAVRGQPRRRPTSSRAPPTARPLVVAEALRAAVLGEDSEVLATLDRRATSWARRTRAPSTGVDVPETDAPCTPCSPPTSSPPRTAPASCTRRRRSAPRTSRSAARYGLPVVNPRAPGRHLRAGRRRSSAACSSRRPTPRSSTTSRRAGCCSSTCRTSTATRTAGAATRRSSTTRSRRGTSAPPR